MGKIILKLCVLTLSLLIAPSPSSAQDRNKTPPKESPIPDDPIPEIEPEPAPKKRGTTAQKIEIVNGFVDLDVKAIKLTDFVSVLSRVINKSILVDPKLERVQLTLKLSGVSWKPALKFVADISDCELQQQDGVFIFSPKATQQYYFENIEIRKVLLILAKIANRNILIPPQIKGRISIDIKNQPVSQVMNRVVRAAGNYELQEHVNNLRLVQVNPRIPSSWAPGFKRLSLRSRSNVMDSAKLRKFIDVSIEDLELHTVMADLSKKLGVKIEVAANVKDKVSLSLREVPARDAIRIIAQIANCQLTERRGVIHLHQDKKFDLEAESLSIPNFVQKLENLTGRRILIPKEFKGSISISVFQMTALEIVAYFAFAMGDYELEDIPGKALKITKKRSTIKKGEDSSPPEPGPLTLKSKTKLRAEALREAERELLQVSALLKQDKLVKALQEAERVYSDHIHSYLRRAQIDEGDIEAELTKWLSGEAFPRPDLKRAIIIRFLQSRGTRILADMKRNLGFARFKMYRVHATTAQRYIKKILNPRKKGDQAILRSAELFNAEFEKVKAIAKGLAALEKLKLNVQMTYCDSTGDTSKFNASKQECLAIVDGYLYKVGDSFRDGAGKPIPGLTIKEIQPQIVFLTYKNEITVRFGPYGPFLGD